MLLEKSQIPDNYIVFFVSFQAYEMGTKAFDLLKQLPQQESLEAIGRLLKLINSKPFYTK